MTRQHSFFSIWGKSATERAAWVLKSSGTLLLWPRNELGLDYLRTRLQYSFFFGLFVFFGRNVCGTRPRDHLLLLKTLTLKKELQIHTLCTLCYERPIHFHCNEEHVTQCSSLMCFQLFINNSGAQWRVDFRLWLLRQYFLVESIWDLLTIR